MIADMRPWRASDSENLAVNQPLKRAAATAPPS